MFEDKQTALETYFQDNITGIEIVFENDPSPSPELFTEFVRHSVKFGDGYRMQIGGKGYRYFGLVIAQIFQKEGVGTSRGVSLADTIANLFRDLYVGTIYFNVPTVMNFPARDGWFQVQVSSPFYFDEVLP